MSAPTPSLERHWAAELIRAARRSVRSGNAHLAAEQLDWALLLAPNSEPATRLRMDLLIDEGHLDAAEAMIARRRLRHPDDPRLLLRRALCRRQRGDLARAAQDIRAVWAADPHRRGPLELAAEIATSLGELDRAVELYRQLFALAPHEDRMLIALSRALIETGEAHQAAEAEELLRALNDPPPLLLAQALFNQNRHRDALDLLEAALHKCENDELVALYIEALNLCGRTQRIEALLYRVDPISRPRSALALARIMLAQGRCRAAIGLSLPIVRNGEFARADEAMPIFIVASSFHGRPRLARRALARFRARANQPSVDVPSWVDSWRRGLQGQLVDEQRCGTGAHSGTGCDPSSSVLRPILCKAAATIEGHLGQLRTETNEEGLSHIENDLALCRSALGVC